jgi:hypothetical protein
MMARVADTVWNGTQAEGEALIAALVRNCACVTNTAGVRTSTCPGHDAFFHNQRFLDHLLYARRMVARLQCEEFMLPEPRE